MKCNLKSLIDWMPMVASLTLAAILLCGCASPTVKESLIVGPDRPWLNKPPEIAAAGDRPLLLNANGLQRNQAASVITAPPPKIFLIQCEVDGTLIAGLQWGLERSGDLTNWTLVQTVPAPATAQTVSFTGTNDQPMAFYRVRTIWPQ